ncbi:MAG: sigma-70 family RNA polymerase sigma factor [Betaproteobacteria bacterium]|nr:sigma-70 family RNA polymerase sigma factor [Betaproteobacteria bacterium]
MADEALNQQLATLLARTGIGDRNAFADLYQNTQAKLFGVALRIVRERHLAEEVLQDAFVNIWNHAAQYATARSAPMTWMTAVVRNRALDLVRRPHLEVQDEDEVFTNNLQDERAGPADQLESARDQARIERCMKGLDEEQRQTISLAFYHGLSHSEVADHLRRPLGTIKTHIRRGLLKLKGCLES